MAETWQLHVVHVQIVHGIPSTLALSREKRQRKKEEKDKRKKKDATKADCFAHQIVSEQIGSMPKANRKPFFAACCAVTTIWVCFITTHVW